VGQSLCMPSKYSGHSLEINVCHLYYCDEAKLSILMIYTYWCCSCCFTDVVVVALLMLLILHIWCIHVSKDTKFLMMSNYWYCLLMLNYWYWSWYHIYLAGVGCTSCIFFHRAEFVYFIELNLFDIAELL
jgi:hypothetical protein